jgi:two-component system NtrC family sensor kinase
MKQIKHIVPVLVFMLMVSSMSSAQNAKLIPQQRLDSLQQLIKNHPEDDEQKVIWLNNYAQNCFYNFDIIDGFNAALKARKASKKTNFKGGEILYHLSVAVVLQDTPGFEEHYDTAKQLSEERNQSQYFAEIKNPKGYPLEWNPEMSKKLEDAIAYFTEKEEKEIQVELIGLLAGYNYFFEKNYDKSRVLAKQAQQLYKELGDEYWIIRYQIYESHNILKIGNESELKKSNEAIISAITKVSDNDEKADLYTRLAMIYLGSKKQLALSVDYCLLSIELYKKTKNFKGIADSYYTIYFIYGELEMLVKQAEASLNVLEYRKLSNDNIEAVSLAYVACINTMLNIKNYDKAKEFLLITKKDTTLISPSKWIILKHKTEGVSLMNAEKYREAIPVFELLSAKSIEAKDPWDAPFSNIALAKCYFELGELNTALKHALLCLKESNSYGSDSKFSRNENLMLFKIYDTLGEKELAYNYLKKYQKSSEDVKLKEETNMVLQTEMRTVLNINNQELARLDQERTEQVQANKMQRVWIFSITGGLISAILILLIVYRNNKSKQKANTLLNQQKEEIEQQKNKAESTLSELKSAQAQLIQSEKMASLGELTAGIAHEIQNPLNFVNNFSEVSNELLHEMKEELTKGDKDEAMTIADDVIQNLEKISHHGLRASGIVKGMLDHSRSNSGTKEPVDINVLADEYLRLAYHGLRAKDKSFNATLNTDFDASIDKIQVVPQDMGRVILNLITNAFYTVHEKKKSSSGNYDPTVTVKTKKSGNNVEVQVTDNGNGIPQKALDKIFQPFFTTKPTGQGTGLGLSLSYDIVKAHGGELKVETKEGIGSTFIIKLPIV